ncbi:hypothetical protein RB2052 [Rhodopirellula baltica SH 1]|uniref:Uncharacterized protein n=1 Tax=Rhodopirellula baltica (strain DSM 10527 / NCIMB 13988 / SH1) TaxID=243090 RepID=Q7UWG5_RHOBA|nr:hypothetical protein RB2052 [Rhodopirellula baltica SH 1]
MSEQMHPTSQKATPWPAFTRKQRFSAPNPSVGQSIQTTLRIAPISTTEAITRCRR